MAGIIAGIVPAILLLPAFRWLLLILIAALFIASVSFIDDRRGVSPALRLLIHLAAALLAIHSGIWDGVSLTEGEWSRTDVITVLAALGFVVWMVNLYNFMDGMDGFAGGMTMFGFTALAAFGWIGGHVVFVAASLVVAAATAGFLLFNFPPARIFMGDVGSASLGLLAAAFSLWGTKEGLFPFWAVLLIFSPFIVDATVTLGRRLINGERVWEAHRTHYYQRLVRLGWGHRKTLLWEYALMALCAISALWGARQEESWQWTILIAWAALYLVLGSLVAALEKRRIRENVV